MAIVPVIKTKNDNTDIPDVLTTKCDVVSKVDDEVKQIAQDLIETARDAKDPEAAGLAAPQIGISKRVCLVRKFQQVGQTEIIKDYILINPEISSKSSKTGIKWEGCLSIPGLYGQVERSKRVTVSALNVEGEKIKIKAEGFFARVIQHELDHLDGVLFTSKSIGKTLTEAEFKELKEKEADEGKNQ